MGKNKKKDPILSQEEYAFQAAEEKWQEEYEDQMKYELDLMSQGALIERERIINSLKKFLEQVEKENFDPIEYKDLPNETYEDLRIDDNLDIEALINWMISKKYFNKKYKSSVESWFKGLTPRNPILINVSADVFVSLIADLIDNKMMVNTKTYIAFLINKSFRFKGEERLYSSIYQIMKPNDSNKKGNKNRISHQSGKIPDINEFLR